MQETSRLNIFGFKAVILNEMSVMINAERPEKLVL